jgi:hypothetical protein
MYLACLSLDAGFSAASEPTVTGSVVWVTYMGLLPTVFRLPQVQRNIRMMCFASSARLLAHAIQLGPDFQNMIHYKQIIDEALPDPMFFLRQTGYGWLGDASVPSTPVRHV